MSHAAAPAMVHAPAASTAARVSAIADRVMARFGLPETAITPDVDASNPLLVEVTSLVAYATLGLGVHEIAQHLGLAPERIEFALLSGARRLRTDSKFSAAFHAIRHQS